MNAPAPDAGQTLRDFAFIGGVLSMLMAFLGTEDRAARRWARAAALLGFALCLR